jgi:hypothetical protein
MEQSMLVPTINVTTPPGFEYQAGQIVMVDLPSLGIMDTLQIQEVTMSHRSNRQIVLGKPEEAIQRQIKNLSKNMETGQRMSTKGLNALADSYVDMKHPPNYTAPLGKITLGPYDLWEPTINLNTDTLDDGSSRWFTAVGVGHTGAIDPIYKQVELGLVIDFGAYFSCGMGVPISLDFGFEAFKEIKSININYSVNKAFSGGFELRCNYGDDEEVSLTSGFRPLKSTSSYSLNGALGSHNLVVYDRDNVDYDTKIESMSSYVLMMIFQGGHYSSADGGTLTINSIDIIYETGSGD